MMSKLNRIFEFVLMYNCIVVFHELGHFIAFMMTGVEVYGFTISLSNIMGGVFSWQVRLVNLTFLELLWILLLLPLIIEYSFIYLSENSKWWYLFALFLHRFDMIMLLESIR